MEAAGYIFPSDILGKNLQLVAENWNGDDAPWERFIAELRGRAGYPVNADGVKRYITLAYRDAKRIPSGRVPSPLARAVLPALVPPGDLHDEALALFPEEA